MEEEKMNVIPYLVRLKFKKSIFLIFLSSLFLLSLNFVSAEEKKVTKQTKSSANKNVSDTKKFDDLRVSEANIWRCENNVFVRTAESAQGFLMLWNTKLYTMSRVDALNGVQRYSNEASHLHWVEIPEKAMLFNFKIGQRILDYCKTPELASKRLATVQEDLLK
jgi:hypothetical protein